MQISQLKVQLSQQKIWLSQRKRWMIRINSQQKKMDDQQKQLTQEVRRGRPSHTKFEKIWFWIEAIIIIIAIVLGVIATSNRPLEVSAACLGVGALIGHFVWNGYFCR